MTENESPFSPFLDTSEKNKLRDHIKDIAKMLVDHEVKFLCGAGLSSESRAAIFSELSDTIIMDILKIKKEERNLHDERINVIRNKFSGEALAGAYIIERGEARLHKMLAKAYSSDLIGHSGHQALKHWVSEGFINRIYTTNYDTLLEKEFGGLGAVISNQNISDIENKQAEGKIPTIHLHGRIESDICHDILITEQETYSYDTPVSYLLRSDLITNWFVFLGFSMNDMDFRSVYFFTQKIVQDYGQGKKTYVVLSLEDEDKTSWRDKWKFAKIVWEHRNAILIPMDCVAFLEELRIEVDDIIDDEYISQLKKQLNVKDNKEISEMIDKRLKGSPGLSKRGALIAIAESIGYDFQ